MSAELVGGPRDGRVLVGWPPEPLTGTDHVLQYPVIEGTPWGPDGATISRHLYRIRLENGRPARNSAGHWIYDFWPPHGAGTHA